MIDKQITPQPNSYGNIIPTSMAFAESSFSQFKEEDSDWSLGNFLVFLKRRAIIVTGVVCLVMTGVTYSTLTKEPVYKGNFQLLVESVNDENDIKKLSLGDSDIIPKSGGLDYDSQIKVLSSPELMGDVIKQLQKSYPDITYGSLFGNLTIRRIGATKIIEVSYQSHETQKIKTVLDTISQFYLQYSLNKRQTKLRQGLQFMDKQLPDIQKRVAQLQIELQVFRQKYGFIDPDSQSAIISNQITGLQQQRVAVNQELATARNNYLSLQTKEGQITVLSNSPLYQQLISQQRKLDTQISEELARFQPDHPIVRTLQEKRDNLLPIIQNEARRALNIKIAEAATLIEKASVNNQQLAQSEQKLQRELEQLPVATRQYVDIQRNLQLANESLTRFLANREKLQVEVAQTELPWELLQATTQLADPISPNISRNLVLGFVASLLLGIGAGKIVEDADNTYHTIESIQSKIKLPILGTLPFDKVILRTSELNSSKKVLDNKIVASDINQNVGQSSYPLRQYSENNYYGQGDFWESLQILYGNIQLLHSNGPISSLIISSSMPGDGKSTMAFHLARTAAAMGKRVLLVDADLRIPQIHKLSNLSNFCGLSNLISSDVDVEQVIRKIPTVENLSVVTAGQVPPDPCRLLASDKMQQLMEYFHQSFDLVIYDTPPMLGLVDARLIAPHTDGVMLVVRMNKTDKSALKQVQDSLKVYPINLLGIVINGDKSHSKYREYEKYFRAFSVFI